MLFNGISRYFEANFDFLLLCYFLLSGGPFLQRGEGAYPNLPTFSRQKTVFLVIGFWTLNLHN